MCRICQLRRVFREGREVVEEEEGRARVHEGFGNEAMVCAKERDAVQRASGKVVGDFSPELPAEH
jgi:hypothetical protein